jgi:galactonate dehydratase
VATAAAVQLDASIPNFIIQEWFPYHQDEYYALVQRDLERQAADGYYHLPDTPGLGVELDDEVMAQYDCVQIR